VRELVKVTIRWIGPPANETDGTQGQGNVVTKIALALIDMQNDVVYGRWWKWWPEVNGIVGVCGDLIEQCRATETPVLYTKVEYKADGSNTPQAIATGIAQPTEYLIERSPGTDIVMRLAPKGEDVVATKNLVSAFSSQNFDQSLRDLGIGTLIVAGLAAEGGVRATVDEGIARGIRTIVVADACGAFSESSYQEMMNLIFPATAEVVRSDDVAALLEARRP
jgi:nicotinamidase-related amidase